MANNQFINLEELSKTTQALLSKINEQANLKVNKSNIEAIVTEGTKIADIEGVEIYAPEVEELDWENISNVPDFATVAYTGDYYDLSNTPQTNNFMVKSTDYVTAGKKSGTILGDKATAEGYDTTASGTNSHAEGYNTTAQRKSQHVFGEYNILDTTGTTTTRGQYVEIVGKGTGILARSNARTLDWSGNEVLAGKLTVGAAPTANMDVTTKQYVDNKITTDIATAIGNINSFDVSIVSNLPTTNISTHTIYFKSNSSSGNNIYDEYMYINNNWELIGSTQIDLTPYALSANLATVATSGSYNDLSNTPNLATVATSGDYDDLIDAPVAETDANVEDMLDDFDLDYTSDTLSPNMWQGGSY